MEYDLKKHREEIINYKQSDYADLSSEDFEKWKEGMLLINDVHELVDKFKAHGGKIFISYSVLPYNGLGGSSFGLENFTEIDHILTEAYLKTMTQKQSENKEI